MSWAMRFRPPSARIAGLGVGVFAAAFGTVLSAAELAAGSHEIDTIVPTANTSAVCFNGSLGWSAICRTDDPEVYYGWESSVPTGTARDNIRTVVDNKYGANTDLDSHWVATSSIQYTGSSETDWVFRQGTATGSFNGETYCDDASDGADHRCDQHYIVVEPGSWVVSLICHEAGHAAGLVHGGGASPAQGNTASVLGCMKTPVATTDTNIGDLNRHNIDGAYN